MVGALEWPRQKAAGCPENGTMCPHVPNKESFDLEALDRQMVRYYGHYSNVALGKRKKRDQDGLISSDSEPVEDSDFSGEGS